MAAAAARKLQKEIETTMKKVEDGLTEFDDCWEQASCVSSRDQKEKLGEELKRCINKLQRWRSQIRDWISANGVQGKDKLENARKRIETDMHRFKDFERELKTKAFSTCGLQRGDELELEEAEKLKYQDWLRETIQCLKDQLEQYEADVEILSSKKSLSSDDKARMAALKTHQERHGWHIEKLELLLRAVDNDSVDMGDLAVLRESVEVYVESHEGPDCYHDESMYDCFDLAQYEDKAQPVHRIDKTDDEDISAGADAAASSKEETPRNKKEKDKKKRDEKKEKKKPEAEKKAAATAAQESTSRQNSGKSVDAKAAPANANEAKGGGEEKLEPEEEKVQEDQLLSEAEEFICKICQIHVVGCGPKLTSCSHLFCGDCIAQWIAQHPECQTWAQRARAAGPERVVPCPVCKQPLNEKRDLYPVCGLTSRSENLLLWRMLSSLKIMCANHPKVKSGGKCDWIGEYGSYQKHARVCKNQPSGDAASTRSGVSPTAASAKVVAPTNPEPEAKAEPASRDASRKNTPSSVPAAAETVAEETASSAAPTQEAIKEQTPSVVSPPQQEPQGNTGGTTKPATQQPPQPAVVTAAPSAADAASTEVAASVDAQASAPQPTAPVTAAAQPQAEKTPAPKASETAPAAAAPKAESSVRNDEQSAASGAATATKGYPEQQEAARTQQAQAKAPQPAPQQSRGPDVIVATRAFEPTSSNMLSVKVGDRLQVSESHATGWTFAVHLTSRAEKQEGWVPSWVVELSQQQAQEEEQQQQSQAKAAAAAQAAAAQAAQQAAAAQAAAAAAAAAAEQRRQQAAREQAAREQAAREQAAREQAAREQAAREQAAREHAARVQAAREQAAREQAAREQAAREQAAREQAAREHALREQAMAQQRAQQLAQHQAQQKARQQAQQAQQAQQGVVDGHTRHLTRATSPFNAGTASQMSLSQHELVEVVERHSSGWTYGRKIVRDITDGSIQEGWFPDWVVRN